jgi:hypothetical protein
MKYQVTFMERTDAAGNPSEKPPQFVEPELTDGIVLDASLVERIEPDSLHGQDVMDEDDNFLSVGTELWEYDVAAGREQEFEDALKNSQMVIDYQAIDDSATPLEDSVAGGASGSPAGRRVRRG